MTHSFARRAPLRRNMRPRCSGCARPKYAFPLSLFPPADAKPCEPRRTRKLRIRRSEGRRLASAVQREGMTLVPLKVYFNLKGIAKIELGIAKGKKLHDKRQSEKARDWARDKARLMRVKG